MAIPYVRTGKTGSDAVNKQIHRIATILTHYGPKFSATIDEMTTGGYLTAPEANALRLFLSDMNTLLAATAKMAEYTNVD